MVKPKSRTLYCSFCLKSDRQGVRLAGGPSVYICDGCVALCAAQLRGAGKTAPEFAGWDAYTNEELLLSLTASEATAAAVRRDLKAKIDLLRERGVSWAMIGEALGISRQAAWERFSRGDGT